MMRFSTCYFKLIEATTVSFLGVNTEVKKEVEDENRGLKTLSSLTSAAFSLLTHKCNKISFHCEVHYTDKNIFNIYTCSDW